MIRCQWPGDWVQLWDPRSGLGVGARVQRLRRAQFQSPESRDWAVTWTNPTPSWEGSNFQTWSQSQDGEETSSEVHGRRLEIRFEFARGTAGVSFNWKLRSVWHSKSCSFLWSYNLSRFVVSEVCDDGSSREPFQRCRERNPAAACVRGSSLSCRSSFSKWTDHSNPDRLVHTRARQELFGNGPALSSSVPANASQQGGENRETELHSQQNFRAAGQGGKCGQSTTSARRSERHGGGRVARLSQVTLLCLAVVCLCCLLPRLSQVLVTLSRLAVVCLCCFIPSSKTAPRTH